MEQFSLYRPIYFGIARITIFCFFFTIQVRYSGETLTMRNFFELGAFKFSCYERIMHCGVHAAH